MRKDEGMPRGDRGGVLAAGTNRHRGALRVVCPGRRISHDVLARVVVGSEWREGKLHEAAGWEEARPGQGLGTSPTLAANHSVILQGAKWGWKANLVPPTPLPPFGAASNRRDPREACSYTRLPQAYHRR